MTHPTLEELVAEISDELGITPDTAWDKQLLDAIRKALTTAKEQGEGEEAERWINQPANEHDEAIREAERERIIKQAPSMPLYSEDYVEGFADCNRRWIEALTPNNQF